MVITMTSKGSELVLGDLKDIWFEYDRQNDILYINFGYDVEDADESLLTESNVVVRIKSGRVVSLTIFDFSKKIGLE
ncbi:MAG: DUF2283 domain-containing protein [Sulfolobales archaeon]|nr:DUF2283 domain-containing protein [Sulfolobales archaeon]